MTLASLSSGVQRSAQHPLFPAMVIAGLGIALLAGAYAFEYLGGLKPCPLCLEQRWPWRVLILIGAAIVGTHSLKVPAWAVVALYALAALVALYGAYLAGYHAGIEYKWWPGPAECTGGGIVVPGDSGLLEGLSSAEIVFCDKVAWSMLGISMAGYNFLFSLAAVVLAAMGGLKGFK
ncbi:MAG: disulfide bond formation protein B [Micropepsaceae bacterium]